MAEFPRRGGIYWVDFSPSRGSEQEGKRPAVIVSNDVNNEHSLVVVVAAATSQLATKVYPMNVRLESQSALGEADVLCGQLMTVSKERLGNHLGDLTADEIAQLNRALAKALALPVQAA